jgi:DNA-binding MarR family transcriptional regulator
MEDYLEVIYELITRKGYATTVDISDYLNVSSPSVTKMLQRLNESGHVNYERYRGISLTETGVAVAKNMHDRHGVLADFLKTPPTGTPRASNTICTRRPSKNLKNSSGLSGARGSEILANVC